jgi:hypothetical protein
MAETTVDGAVPTVHRPGGPRINIVQMGKYGVGFVDVEEVALGICRSVGLARELGGRVVERAREFSYEIFRRSATLSRE